MNRFIILLCLSLMLMGSPGCNYFKFGWERDDAQKVEWNEEEREEEGLEGLDGPLGGHFDDEGNWVPDDPTIASTYQIPDIGSGFIFDVATLDITPSLQIELLEFNTHIPYINKLKLDFGVGYNRAFFYVGKLFTNIFEISAGIYVGWNFDNFDWKHLRGGEFSYGVGGTIIKF